MSNRPASLVIQNGACEPATALQPSVSFSIGADAVNAVRGNVAMNAVNEMIEIVIRNFCIKLNLLS